MDVILEYINNIHQYCRTDKTVTYEYFTKETLPRNYFQSLSILNKNCGMYDELKNDDLPTEIILCIDKTDNSAISYAGFYGCSNAIHIEHLCTLEKYKGHRLAYILINIIIIYGLCIGKKYITSHATSDNSAYLFGTLNFIHIDKYKPSYFRIREKIRTSLEQLRILLNQSLPDIKIEDLTQDNIHKILLNLCVSNKIPKN